MGGANQSTCSPPKPGVFSSSLSTSLKFGSVRSHEDPKTNQIHFHDDSACIKCTIDSAEFTSQFETWISGSGKDPLFLLGNDNRSNVQFHLYVDDQDELQIGIIVSKSKLGQSIKDLMQLAGIPQAF